MTLGLESAKKLGLNEYESKAYLSLLEVGSSSASRLSVSSAIPRARIYDVLVSLEKKGFVEKQPVKPLTYAAVSPLSAVKKFESMHRKDFDESMRELSDIAGFLEKRFSMKKESVDTGDVVLVSGWKNILSHIAEKLEGAKSEVVFSSVSADRLKHKREIFSSEISSLLNRGVNVKFRKSTARYFLFDKKSLILFLNPPSAGTENEKALLLENEFVARHFLKK